MNADRAVAHYPDQVKAIRETWEESDDGILQRNVDIPRSDFRTFIESGLLRHIGYFEYYVEQKDGFSHVKLWEPSAKLKQEWHRVDHDRGTMLPCDCLKDGFINRGEQLECKNCGQLFEKEKAKL